MRYRYGPQALIHEWADQQIAGITPITAAVPLGTAADPFTGNAVSPTTVLKSRSSRTEGKRPAEPRDFSLQFATTITPATDSRISVTSFPALPTPHAVIRTDYGPGSSASVTSGYGRGTTTKDVPACKYVAWLSRKKPQPGLSRIRSRQPGSDIHRCCRTDRAQFRRPQSPHTSRPCKATARGSTVRQSWQPIASAHPRSPNSKPPPE